MRPSWVTQGFGEYNTHSKMSGDGGGSYYSSTTKTSTAMSAAQKESKRLRREMEDLKDKVRRMEAAMLAQPEMKALYEQELLVDKIKGIGEK